VSFGGGGLAVFGWFRKKPEPPSAVEKVARQPPGEVFPWAKGWRLTALDEAMITVPAAILGDNEAIGSVIHCDDGVRLNLPTAPHATPGERITIWLQPGESVWLSKSCQGVVVPQSEGDTAARRFRLTEVAPDAEPGAAADGGACRLSGIHCRSSGPAAAELGRSAAEGLPAVDVADYLFERSRGVIRAWPRGLAELFELLVWTMDDNGAEVMRAVERWLLSDDFERVRVAVELREVFPFRHRAEMDAALAVVKARWPELAERCESLSAERAACVREADPVPTDVAARVRRLQELVRQVRA
jgi:hypothetical protein